MSADLGGVRFLYALTVLPPGRVGFRRWRWELWDGGLLLACGWRLARHQAERALRAAANHAAHVRLGLRVVRPERAVTTDAITGRNTVLLSHGRVRCVLEPRGEPDAAAA